MTRPGSSSDAGTGWAAIFRGPRGQLTLGLLLLEFTGAFHMFTINTVLPEIVRELDGQRWYGAALTAMIVGAILAVPVTGPLSARWGLARTLAVATPVYLIGVVASAVAPTMAVFIAARFVQGLAAGAMAAIGLGTLAKEYEGEHRARVMSLMSSMWIVPALLGPPYAALVAELVGWRWSLVLLLPVLLVARVLIAARISAVPGPTGRRTGLPLVRALVLAASIGGFLVALARGDVVGWALAAVGLVIALAALTGIFPAGTFAAQVGPRAAVLAMLLLTTTYFAAQGLITLSATEDLLTPVLAGGLALTVGAVSWSCTSLLAPRLLKNPRVGPHRMAVTGTSLITAACLGVLTLVSSDLTGWGAAVLLCAAWGVGSVGMGLGYNAIALVALEPSRDEDAGTTASAVVLAEIVGGCFAGAVGGGLVAVADAVDTGRLGTTGLSYGVAVAVGVLLVLVAIRVRSGAGADTAEPSPDAGKASGNRSATR